MKTLRHPRSAGVRTLRDIKHGTGGVPLFRPVCELPRRSAACGQELRISWQRNPTTGQVEGRWHLSGTNDGRSAPPATALREVVREGSECGVRARVAPRRVLRRVAMT